MSKSNPVFMSGVPELLILRLLSRKEMYGYELVKEIRLASNESISLAEGVIYPLLHSLEKKGLVKPKKKVVDSRSRIYYSITTKGGHRLDNLLQEWARVSGGIKAVFGGAHA